MKITTNELRLGNYFQLEKDVLGGGVCRISKVKDFIYLNQLINSNGVKPIPLTEEWLLNFGFRKEATKVSGGICYILEGLSVIVKDGIFYFTIKQLQSRYIKIVEYVHTLQNLCFDIRDIELTLSK